MVTRTITYLATYTLPGVVTDRYLLLLTLLKRYPPLFITTSGKVLIVRYEVLLAAISHLGVFHIHSLQRKSFRKNSISFANRAVFNVVKQNITVKTYLSCYSCKFLVIWKIPHYISLPIQVWAHTIQKTQYCSSFWKGRFETRANWLENEVVTIRFQTCRLLLLAV